MKILWVLTLISLYFVLISAQSNDTSSPLETTNEPTTPKSTAAPKPTTESTAAPKPTTESTAAPKPTTEAPYVSTAERSSTTDLPRVSISTKIYSMSTTSKPTVTTTNQISVTTTDLTVSSTCHGCAPLEHNSAMPTEAVTTGEEEKSTGFSSLSKTKTTEKSVTTEAPPSGGNLYYLKDGNVTCILLNANLTFNISYSTGSTSAYKYFDLPSNTTVQTSGSCTKDDQKIILSWTPTGASQPWKFEMHFDEEQKDKSNYVDKLILQYEVSKALFPDTTNKTGPVEAMLGNQTLFKSASVNYFRCKSNETFTLEGAGNVELLFSDVFVQGFRTDANQTYTGTAQQCAKDAETNNIVPIAVGAALAALVVIVLIAYLISRNRNKGGYESV